VGKKVAKAAGGNKVATIQGSNKSSNQHLMLATKQQ